MGRVSGGLWIVGGLLAIAGALLPGAAHRSTTAVLLASAAALAYGASSVAGLIPWERASSRFLFAVMVVTIPAVGASIYLTGGSLSYVQPILVSTLLYAALFFRPRQAWILTSELVLVAGAPLLYEGGAVDAAFPSRYLGIAITYLAVTGVMIGLKRRLVEAEAQQREIAHRDPLTGVANRRAFEQTLRARIGFAGAAHGRRNGDRQPFALILFDLDDFKAVNDEHGHPAGDQVLRVVTGSVAGVLRSTDLLARIGGDEFAVIAPGAHGEGASRLAESVRAAVASAQPMPGVPGPGASLGIAIFPEDGDGFEDLLHTADKRLLRAKRNRRHFSARRDSASLRLI